MLTSEIPFLEKYDSTGEANSLLSELDFGSSDLSSNPFAVMSTIDIDLLIDYCRNLKPFPIESLQRNRVNKDGIGFVRSLMVAKPRDRVSAADALKSVWLVGTVSRIPSVIPALCSSCMCSYRSSLNG